MRGVSEFELAGAFSGNRLEGNPGIGFRRALRHGENGMTRRLLFLPGAGADPDFWKPLGNLLPDTWEKIYFGWPGLGNQKRDPAINCLDDLVTLVEESLGYSPVDLLAQSMGGSVAVRLLLKHPEKIRRVVFTATGAGLPMADYGGADWKTEYQKNILRLPCGL